MQPHSQNIPLEDPQRLWNIPMSLCRRQCLTFWYKGKPLTRHDPRLQELCTLWPRDAHWEKWRQVKDGVRLLPTPPILPTSPAANDQRWPTPNSKHDDKDINECTTVLTSRCSYAGRWWRQWRSNGMWRRDIWQTGWNKRHWCWRRLCYIHKIVLISRIHDLLQPLRRWRHHSTSCCCYCIHGSFKGSLAKPASRHL